MICYINFTRRSVIKFILIIVTLLSENQAYNLNVDSAKVFNHPHKYQQNRANYFGFTVALYNSPNYEDQSVLVGAPRANTSQVLVIEPGTVFKCTLNKNCNEWSLDNTVGQSYDSGTIFRDNSWLGASISVENKENPSIVVCAPRWKIKWGSPWYMNGICYYTKINSNQSFYNTPIKRIMSFTNRYQQTAIDSNKNGYYKYGMGLLGFSLNTFVDEDGYWSGILGGPGAHSSLGTAVFVSQNKYGFNNYIPDYDDVNQEYLGYSVTTGKYFDNIQTQYAAGAPRTTDMKGRVRIFYYNHLKIVRVRDTLHGTQQGAYFGAALASCDIDNDGKDEIIVGAPLWTKNGDEGSIYIFTTKNSSNFKLSLQVNGKVKDARFGTSVVCVGDIDRDGYQDIAVGAPYENNHGAVYIFNGNKNGLSAESSQRISGDKFPYSLRGFGISISEPRDIDGNGYFDIAIGAYLSGHAVVLRSQPVVSVDLKLYTTQMKLSDDASSFPIRVCGSYKGVRAPKSLNIIIRLKVDVVFERAYIDNLKRENRTYIIPSKLLRDKITCRNITILLKERNPNVIDPIEISATLILDPAFQSSSTLSSDNFYFNSPVINKNMSKAEDNITLTFAVDCGIDNICDSNIELNITTNLGDENHFTIGSKDAIQLFINVQNYGEAAYQTEAHILIPQSMALMNVPVNCESTWSTNISEIICNFGNPLIKQNNLTLELVMRQIKNIEDHIEILTFITTQSNNLNFNNSKKKLSIYFDDDVDIALSGNAHETLYSCFDNEKKLEIIKFQHVYEVHKFGVTPIMQTHLIISIPTHIIDVKNKNKIEIAKINQTDISLRTLINKRNSYCIQKEYNSIENRLKYSGINNNLDNRTLNINCMNPLIICATISCFLETSSNLLTIGEVTVTMELQLKNFTDNVMNGTSIIHFISNAHVNITSPTGIIQKPGNKPDYIQVSTTFDSSTAIAISRNVPIWVIVLSAFLGILLLALLTFGLIKLGFFNRKKREELENLKSDEEKRHSMILETTSSKEMLDQD